MKALEFLQKVSEKHEHRMADMPYNLNLTMVLDAMETYAERKQNDIDEILKLVNDLDLWLINKVPVKFVNIYPAKNIINLIQKHTK